MKEGKLIVFEGIDGCGKSTQIERLAARLRADGREVALTAEPTDSVSGKMLRTALSGADKRSASEMAALFLLDRIHHNVSVGGIEETLAKGIDVICDRYYYSSLAYQGCLTDPAWVRSMNLDCPEIRRPDICIFLDLTPEQSMNRISKGRVTTEIYETVEQLTRVRDQFLSVIDSLSARDNIQVVNAARPIEEIQTDIRRIVDELQ